jgi:hypothetical protein
MPPAVEGAVLSFGPETNAVCAIISHEMHISGSICLVAGCILLCIQVHHLFDGSLKN